MHGGTLYWLIEILSTKEVVTDKIIKITQMQVISCQW
jgi:hypothetical protein